MTDDPRVRSAQQAGHWIAWITAAEDERPAGGWTMVGQTKEEAETRAREWWAWRSAEARRYPSPSSSSASSNMSPSAST
jgi:hypothetical protein